MIIAPEVDDPGELVVGRLHAVDDLVARGHVLHAAVLRPLASVRLPGGVALAQDGLEGKVVSQTFYETRDIILTYCI